MIDFLLYFVSDWAGSFFFLLKWVLIWGAIWGSAIGTICGIIYVGTQYSVLGALVLMLLVVSLAWTILENTL